MKYLGDGYTWLISGIGALYTFFTGHVDKTLQLLLIVMIVDIISGLLKGIQQRNIKSAIMHMGILKKSGILLAVFLAFTLDRSMNAGQPLFYTMMVWLSVGTESVSIIENLEALGVRLPKPIKEKIKQIVEKEGKQTQKNGKSAPKKSKRRDKDSG